MKDLWKSGVLILMIIGVLYILFLRECKKPPACPAEDEIIIKKADWQSMIDAANKPATIHIDTFYIKGDVVYVPGIPVDNITDNNPDPAIFNYEDSLINKEIDVRYYFVTEGKLLSKEWSYKPTFTIVKEVDSIPYPVYIKGEPFEVKVPQNGLYLYGTAGGNANSFLFGGGLDFITKKETELGAMYQRFGSDNIYSVKLGIKIQLGKK